MLPYVQLITGVYIPTKIGVFNHLVAAGRCLEAVAGTCFVFLFGHQMISQQQVGYRIFSANLSQSQRWCTSKIKPFRKDSSEALPIGNQAWLAGKWTSYQRFSQIETSIHRLGDFPLPCLIARGEDFRAGNWSQNFISPSPLMLFIDVYWFCSQIIPYMQPWFGHGTCFLGQLHLFSDCWVLSHCFC